MAKKESLRKIKDEVLSLEGFPLCDERRKNNVYPVIGEGSHDADVMFIGEAPGEREAATGRPFCGRAGKILDECLQGIGFKREDAYITNIIKDRPPKNRDPLPEEIEIYAVFLDRQINIIKPKIIATLGRFSSEYILKKFGMEEQIMPISTLHGKPIDTRADYGPIKILPLMHPAVAIYNRKKEKELKEGFSFLKENDCCDL